MEQLLKAIYREGKFIPVDPCDLPDDSEVELLVRGPVATPPPVTDGDERSRILREVTDRMRANPLPVDAPRFSREELHARR